MVTCFTTYRSSGHLASSRLHEKRRKVLVHLALPNVEDASEAVARRASVRYYCAVLIAPLTTLCSMQRLIALVLGCLFVGGAYAQGRTETEAPTTDLVKAPGGGNLNPGLYTHPESIERFQPIVEKG